ncbi:MAG: V-type ATPase subunit [Bacillota bacterium]
MGFDGRFAYVVGRVRALENRMIDQARFNRMIDAEGPEELARIVSETEYSLARDLGPERYEEIIDGELTRVHAVIEGISPDPVLTGVFRARHDFDNMKAHLKARLARRDRGVIVEEGSGVTRLGRLDPARLGAIADALVLGGEDDEVEAEPEGEYMSVRQRADDLEGAVVEAARRAVLAYEANGRDPQYVDLVLDRESFEYFYHVARSRRADFLIDLVQATADLTNILICMRLRLIGKPADFARDALLPRGTLDIEALLAVYSEPDDAFWSFFKRTRYDRLVEQALTAWRGSGSLSAFENAIRAGLAREAATGGMADMGYEPVLAYLMAREGEADILRRIFVGKMNRLPSEVIRERLCGVYA